VASQPNIGCAVCGATTREVDPELMDPTNGKLLIGSLRISVQKRTANGKHACDVRESAEYRRYCPSCAVGVETLLKALDFTLES
jgi:hypothetical protein